LLGRVESLICDCRMVAHKAQQAREWHAAVSALREVRWCLELLGEISGELKKQEGQYGAPLIAPVLITQYVEVAKDGTPVKIVEVASPSPDRPGIEPHDGTNLGS
jgi:hypothetical protein